VYEEENVVHYCVANLPGAVPTTSTIALTNATFPYVRLIAEHGLNRAIELNPAILSAVNIRNREIVHPAVAALWEAPPASVAGEVA
jgi:alanine dehydrogenase